MREFDLSGGEDLPACIAEEQGERGRTSRRRSRGRAARRSVESLPLDILGRGRPQGSRVARCAPRGTPAHGLIWGIGAHVLKTGLSPIAHRSLMERGYICALAMNGAGVIHDFELALSGATSEDVDEALGPGRFGMAEETGRELNARDQPGAWRRASVPNRSIVEHLHHRQPPFAEQSSVARRRPDRLEIPVTVHVGDRHRHHPHAQGRVGRRARRRQPARLPLLRLERRAARERRVSELRVRRRAAGSVPEGGRARAQHGPLVAGPDDRATSTSCGTTGRRRMSSHVLSPASARDTRSSATTRS